MLVYIRPGGPVRPGLTYVILRELSEDILSGAINSQKMYSFLLPQLQRYATVGDTYLQTGLNDCSSAHYGIRLEMCDFGYYNNYLNI